MTRSLPSFRICARLGLATLLATALSAQKLSVPVDGDRSLQLYDLSALRPDGEPGDGSGPGERECAQAAELVRQFVAPTLRDGDDVRGLGGRWIAVLADAERTAAVARLFDAARRHRNDLLHVEVRLFTVAAAAFQQHLRDQLVEDASKPRGERLVPAADAAAFLASVQATGAAELSAPRLTVRPLQLATFVVGDTVAYVQDFQVTHDGGRTLADPIVDTVFSGTRSEVCATFLPGDHIGLNCSLLLQEVERPIPEVETHLAGSTVPLKIQLPKSRSVRLTTVAEVDPGALITIAAPQRDGNYLLAVVTATVDTPAAGGR